MATTFEKRGSTRYAVYVDGVFLGNVWKEIDWTVRGDRVRWVASTGGTVIGVSFSSRKEAVSAITE